ncbi:uncharacterized protein [Eucyclogobius newberryi]|uniref:uncharacterized protein n=1 Tax=Eucyclogobius newberryi TaxID=166745 RepID=UPI003B5B9AC6
MAESLRNGHFWKEDETVLMLTLLKELNILKYMDGRKTRNGDLFKKVAEQLRDGGFTRTTEQIRIRWKHLKKTYFLAQKNKTTSGRGRVVCPFGDALEELLGPRPLSQVDHHHGVDFGLQSALDTSVQDTSVQDTSVQDTSVQDTSVQDTSVQDTSVQDTSVQDTSVQDTSVQDTSVQDTSVQDTSVQDTSVQDTSVQDTSVQDTSVQDTSVQDSSVLEDKIAVDGSTGSTEEADTDTPSRPQTPHLPGTSQRPQGRRRNVAHIDLMLERMDRLEAAWMLQSQQSQEREERMINSILDSNERMLSAVMDGIRSFQQPMPMAPASRQKSDIVANSL